MNHITILSPNRLVFGDGAKQTFFKDFLKSKMERLFIITIGPIAEQIGEEFENLRTSGVEIYVDTSIHDEPDYAKFNEILEKAREFKTDSVVGIGGGSVLDVAKLMAEFVENEQNIKDAIGIGNLSGRSIYLACLPTTSGTGSEVSPNAILLDQEENLKKGIVSPYLVPDSVYVDPHLTYSVPPEVTAATGLDALTHCLEAYTNIHAHPMIDLYALEGIRLISSNLEKAIKNGNNQEARTKLAIGSLYGGYCLGPVNTTAVHALSYPLGGMFHVPHGLSNAILLPYVMEFNLVEAHDRFTNVALALGAEEGESLQETAENGVQLVKKLMKKCNVPMRLSELNIPKCSLEVMAASAIKVTRLLKNNIREVSFDDALNIYQQAY